jgi:mannan endo-1,4-beta-mannosidase
LNSYLIKFIYLFTVTMLTSSTLKAQDNFVRVQGSQMLLNGKPYHYVGANYWYGVLLAGVNGAAGKARLKRELDFMKTQGITNLRVFVGAEGEATHPFRMPYAIQPEQGKVDAKLLGSLDYFLAEIGKRQMKAVLFFTNNWDWSGGLTQYLKWNGRGNPPITKGYGNPGTTDGKDYWEEIQKYTTQFYNCDECHAALDNFIHIILTHKNTINGKQYTDDPAIMAWEIMNEPRPMQMSNLPAFQTWMAHVSAYIKSIDKNHLLTTGSEGDIAYSNDMQAFTETHKDPNIDYLTIHIWPKNWQWFKDTAIVASFPQVLANTDAYIKKHVAVAQSLNKPLVLEEFGLPRDRHKFAKTATTNSRDKYYRFMFKALRDNKNVIAGANFWGMGGFAINDPKGSIWKPGADFTCDPGTEEQGLNSVFAGDASTWSVIRRANLNLN